jgi:site-specific DNA-methyltransferase (adenine-specific)
MINKILHGDCLELMKDIPNGSIDMILCDLPYGTTACKWDTIIPFDKLWKHYERIIKPNGAIVLFGTEPFSSMLRTSNMKLYKYDWIWLKTRPSNFFAAKFMPLNDKEIISVFSFGGINNGAKNPMKYFPQGIKSIDRIVKNVNTGGKIGAEHKTSLNDGRLYHQTTTGYPNNLIEFNNDLNTEHPTQKPIALCEYLIKTYTSEGELVLDNTAGSGTTAIACLNTNRQFIVMEKEQKYYDIILKRVADFNKNFEPQTLFGNEM